MRGARSRRRLVASNPPNLPRAAAIGVDGTVFVVGLGLTTLIGLIPVFHAAGSDPSGAMRGGSTRTTGRESGTRSALAVVEKVALAVVLLVSSGLLLRSLQQLFDVEVGFDPKGLQTLQVQVSGDRYDDETSKRRYAQVH